MHDQLSTPQVSKYTIRADFDSANLHDAQPGSNSSVRMKCMESGDWGQGFAFRWLIESA